jgi:hypothetical protein
MKKFFLILAIIFALIGFPRNAHAAEVSHPSATLAALPVTTNNLFDTRARALRNVFTKHNSPLADEAQNYVRYADLYGVDWKLLPAISGLESSFGIYLIQGSYNAYGWGGGRIYFESWEDGIRTINKALRQNYINRGAADVWSIGPIYAESPTWSVRVNVLMNEINEEFLRLGALSVLPNI